jgi:hypothetical protein
MTKKPGPKKGSQKKTPGSGRKRGTPNKNTGVLKDAFIAAAIKAGEKLGVTKAEQKEGMTTYLVYQALNNPNAFMSGISRIIPMQLEGAGEDGEIVVNVRLQR